MSWSMLPTELKLLVVKFIITPTMSDFDAYIRPNSRAVWAMKELASTHALLKIPSIIPLVTDVIRKQHVFCALNLAKEAFDANEDVREFEGYMSVVLKMLTHFGHSPYVGPYELESSALLRGQPRRYAEVLRDEYLRKEKWAEARRMYEIARVIELVRCRFERLALRLEGVAKLEIDEGNKKAGGKRLRSGRILG